MDSIPDELIEKIYQYLRGKDVISFSLTSKRNREILINSYTLDGLVGLNKSDYKIFLHSLPSNLFCINLGCTEITNNALVHLTKIHTLDLWGTGITNNALVHLTKIHTLNLAGTKITNNALVHLTEIHTLDLVGMKITKEGKEFLIGNGVKLTF
jgi:hypothetical protein